MFAWRAMRTERVAWRQADAVVAAIIMWFTYCNKIAPYGMAVSSNICSPIKYSWGQEDLVIFQGNFSHCTVNIYMFCSTKTWQLEKQPAALCLMMWLSYRSEHILWQFFSEIKIMPKGSYNFSCNCMTYLLFLESHLLLLWHVEGVQP